MNPVQMILNQMMKGGNPQQEVMNMLKSQSGNNPMANNLLDMAQKGDSKGIEQMARNMCKEKGIDADQAVEQLKQQFGIK